MNIIVADNSVISNFARLNALIHLKKIFKSVRICPGVEDEIRRGAEKYQFMADAVNQIKEGWVQTESTDDIEMLAMIAELQNTHKRLSHADAASICLAYFKKLPLAIDDKEGVTVCEKYGIQTVGTIDILKMWLDNEIFNKDELNSFLKKLEEECRYSVKFRFN